MEDKFVWTDELVREFALEVKVKGNSDWVTNQMADFKESKEVKKDYEILSIIGNSGSIYRRCKDEYGNDNMMWLNKNNSGFHHDISKGLGDSGCKIHSVKRLSDNSIYVIGDIVVGGKILSFEIDKDGIFAKCGEEIFNANHIYLRNLRKVKEKLFTTTDGKDIYEGDKYWFIQTVGRIDTFKVFSATVSSKTEPHNYNASFLKFSTEEAANEYVLMNKPCLSINDFRSCQLNVELLENNPQYNKLLELAKSKL